MNDTEVLELIGARHGERVAEAYRRLTRNGADARTLRMALVGTLLSGEAQSYADGEALALRQVAELDIPVAPGWLRPERDRTAYREAVERQGKTRDRYSLAVETILAGAPEQVETRLQRMGTAEAMDAARERSAEVMQGTRMVDGWVRQLDNDPCELCTWWHRDGRVWPSGHSMPTHKGCSCAQRWVKAPDISIRYTTAATQRASAEREAAGSLDERRRMHEKEYSSTARGRTRAEREEYQRRRDAAEQRRRRIRDQRRGRRTR